MTTTAEPAEPVSPPDHLETSKPRIFFGWVVVAAAFTVLFIAYGLQFSYGLFVKAIGDDTGWSRTQLSLPYAVYVALYSSLSSVSGRMTDRWGPRRVVFFGGLLLGAGWTLFGLSQQLWQTYIGLGIIAGFGMSAAWVPCNATVVRWFVRRRGLAVGVASSGGSAGNLLAPPLVAALITGIGWRAAVAVLAVTAAVVLAVVSRFLVRDPESRGLHPDGDAAAPALPIRGPDPMALGGSRAAAAADPASATTRPGAALGPSMTLTEARHTITFWLLFGVFGLSWLAVFVPFVHLAPYAEDLGLTSPTAALAVSALGLGGVVGRLSVGWASDRMGRRAALGAMLTFQVCSFIAFAAATGAAALFPAAIGFGFSYGGAVTLFPALVGDAFGRVHAGAIVGTLFAASGTFAAIGPFMAGWVYDALGSYRLAFSVCAGANAAALLLVSLLGRVDRAVRFDR